MTFELEWSCYWLELWWSSIYIIFAQSSQKLSEIYENNVEGHFDFFFSPFEPRRDLLRPVSSKNLAGLFFNNFLCKNEPGGAPKIFSGVVSCFESRSAPRKMLSCNTRKLEIIRNMCVGRLHLIVDLVIVGVLTFF